MRLDILLSLDSPVAPGQKVRWVDREAPLPPDERLTGKVTALVMSWSGKGDVTLDAAIVDWDGPAGESDAIQVDELAQLEVLG